jgi:DNA-binding LacI/PurR family transcriptional regulator
VLACITTYSAEEAKHNIYDQQTMKAARAQALKLGFGLEPFQINAPGMTAERLSRILKVRGIQGLILSPRLPLPGPIPDLDWENFSTVALGYSITNLRVHRTCAHYAHNIRMAMHILRERGYRRIGLIVQYEVFERSMGIVPGTYLAQQYLLPATDRVVPLITRRLTKASLGQWVRRQRVDCIMLSNQPLQVLAWLAELGHKAPRDLGVCCTALSGDKDGVAGIDNQIGLLGEAAVDFVVSMLQQNERGLPVHPRSINIDGIWVEGPTVRAGAGHGG